MAITFFPRPQHKVFNYKPRYYDERKERLKELYAKYGKQYPGDDKVSAPQAAEDLKDVATYSEVKEVIEGGTAGASRSGSYIPGQYIRSAYRQGTADRLNTETKRSPLRTVIAIITVLAAVLVAYYLSQGLVELVR